MEIIKEAQANRKNVVIAGDVWPAHTTDVATVKTFSPSDRIVSVEDCPELKITDAEVARILANTQ